MTNFCEQDTITPANILATVVNYLYDIGDIPVDVLIKSVNETIEADFDIEDIVNHAIAMLETLNNNIVEYKEGL